MKSIFLFFIIIPLVSFGQDTVLIKNRLTDSVMERFYMLKSNIEIKNGQYEAVFRRKINIAIGRFKNNEKVGIWQFFNKNGRLIEKFNYDTNNITYEGPISNKNLLFFFDDSIKTTDRLTRPLKIGGEYYGFIPFLNCFKLPFDTYGINTNLFNTYIELLITPLGKLAWFKVYIDSLYYNYHKNFSFDVNLFSEEDRIFFPATLNGKPILSRIIIRCSLNDDGGLDFL